MIELTVCRYRCLACKVVFSVVPRGVLPFKHYSAGAIAMALTLWAFHRWPAPEIRARLSPFRRVGATAARGWHSLIRRSRGPPWAIDCGDGGPRARALDVARALLAMSPLSAATHTAEARAFAAVHAA